MSIKEITNELRDMCTARNDIGIYNLYPSDAAKVRRIAMTIDEAYAKVEEERDKWHQKYQNQRKQLTEVQNALERRNNGELKRRWKRQLTDLECELSALKACSIELPKDADGEHIFISDKMTSGKSTFTVSCIEVYAPTIGCVIRDNQGRSWSPTNITHYEPDTWESIENDAYQLDIAFNEGLENYTPISAVRELVARCKALAGEDLFSIGEEQ